MERLVPTLIMVAIVAVIFLLMWRGWKARQASFGSLPAPRRPKEDVTTEPFAGMYVATALASDPLERVNVHGLGVRTGARVFVESHGVVFALDGVGEFEIPTDAIVDVGSASGMIGKFVEKDGLVVIQWTLGSTEVCTGFRPRVATEKKELINRIAGMRKKVA